MENGHKFEKRKRNCKVATQNATNNEQKKKKKE